MSFGAMDARRSPIKIETAAVAWVATKSEARTGASLHRGPGGTSAPRGDLVSRRVGDDFEFVAFLVVLPESSTAYLP